ncbi:hypothetical protein KR084_002746 [Drosophila pseudotakahashii]|nr:hypothetical protein KR084_002746 [Drosophila pseudotakahashii]
MIRQSLLLFLAFLLVGQLSALQDTQSHQVLSQDSTGTREKRGTVTLDFGLLLRNLLLKSAQLSSAKANLVRTTRRPPMATTTTPPPPPPPPPPRSRRPIWHPFFSSGFLPLDYADYADPSAARPPVPPPPPPPQPTRRPVRPPVRPRPRPTTTPAPPPPPPPNYDYDYDYDAPAPPPAPTAAPPPPPPPPPRPRPRPRPRPPQQQQLNDPPQRRPAQQLGDRLIYQYAQPTDTFFRSRSVAEAAAVPDDSDAEVDHTDTGADSGANADGAYAADAGSPDPPTPTAPRFLVNYESDSDFGPLASGQQILDQDPPAGPTRVPASPSPSQGYFSQLDFGSLNLNRFPTPNQQQYFYN